MTDFEAQKLRDNHAVLQSTLSAVLRVVRVSTAVMPDEWRTYMNRVVEAADEVITETGEVV